MSAGLGGLGVANGALADRQTALQPLAVLVSAVFLGLAYHHAYRRGPASGPARAWLWITTPLTIFPWILPHLGAA